MGRVVQAAELETATRLGCSYTVVVFTDDDYGLISTKQRDATGDSFGTRLTNPSFGTFAESFGIDSYRPTTRAELRDDLEAAVDGGMSLVEIAVG
ncbi:thiamine pyrophosphate-dependent enzyme [Haloarcula sediminis]|uniref:thiamine pyrophosphate-dependent enzyme n=1 Tax=Haloarcula sediminis TaxID=3111777 RepID=UPI002D77A1E0|nr:thiamine pyrophosphate-dependent enzyme [Haloarcula sp. CK38]